MDRRRRSIAIIIVIALAAACSESAVVRLGGVKDVSPFVQTFLGLRAVTSTSLGDSRLFGPNQVDAYAQYIVGYASIPKRTGLAFDSTVVIDDSQACRKVSQTYHPDGSITMLTDLSDTCTQTFSEEVYKTWGKYIDSRRNAVVRSGSVYDDYFWRSSTENGGSSDVTLTDTSFSVSNGVYSSTGISSYDTITLAYTSRSTWNDTAIYAIDTTRYSYLSFGQYTFSDNKSIVLKSEYNYHSGADYYEATVTIPLVRDFGCHIYSGGGSIINSISTGLAPVSGHEVVKYRQGGIEGTFEIDYGNGHCDAFVEIIEHGKSIALDLEWPYPRTH